MKLLTEFIVLSPFETPDVLLALDALDAGAFPMLALGHSHDIAQQAMNEFANKTTEDFGVALQKSFSGLNWPVGLKRVMLPWGMECDAPENAERIWQVFSSTEAATAIAAGAKAISLKGNESAGRVGEESAFIMFQQCREKAAASGVALYIHGGAGVHTGAAYLALGAKGLVLDSQVALFPECRAPRELKDTLGRLTGDSSMLLTGMRVLKWPAMPKLATGDTDEIANYLGGLDLAKNLIPVGQDFLLAAEYARRYGRLATLLHAMSEAAYGHLRQGRENPVLRPGNPLAKAFGIEYPLVQGPMARVSDEPKFLKAVADAGAMPFLAIGLASPAETAQLLETTGNLLRDQPWGAGLLGFIPPAQFNAQAKSILQMDTPPTAVVIAGGRPVQGQLFEKAGVQAFLHVPSANLLDQYLKDGARKFIFEGRESGGHVGPLHSTVLWEQQLLHLLDAADISALTVFFAGGIHDDLSAAFVSVMTASLAAQGAKIGVVMGTAYLFTKECVANGAITQNFQSQAIAATQTVLLESVPGQETRALPTPFTEVFLAEKARIEAADFSPLEKRTVLEELNLGRARIASKGQDRDATTKELKKVDLAEQITHGLYMAGAVTGMINSALTISELHETVTTGASKLIRALPPIAAAAKSIAELGQSSRPKSLRPHDEPIAIIGMAGIFPDADDLNEFWRNMLLGHDAVREIPPERWPVDVFYDNAATDTDFVVSKWGGFLSAAEFDPVEFGITPQSVSSVEPSQLLSLLVAKRALQDAGYTDLQAQILEDTSVIIGTEAVGELSSAYGSRPGIRAMFGFLPEKIDSSLPRVDENSFAGILSTVAAGRIANRLNCGGRNFTVDAACASSLAALDLACRELWADRSKMVICGGTDLHNGILDYIMFSATHALSPRGYCATFDESGDGLVLGEGVGAVILKRLADAERDGDKIYAVVRGIEGSSDGRSLGLTAPNMHGQVKALQRAYRTAGVSPADVGMVEAHGTGTAVGDRTELTALQRVMLDAGALPGQTWIGSVKTQIGHTKCAAGVTSLIRTALAVRHGVIPPTLHLEKPVSAFQKGMSPFAFNANGHATLWTDERRVAGLSGFGFGGTNFHAVVENYRPEVPQAPVMSAWSRELFVFRGATLAAAQEKMRQVKALYAVNRRIALRDVAYSLALDGTGPVQVCVVSGSWEKLVAKLDHALEGKPSPGVFYRDERPGKVAFLFSGQGSQRVNMARGLFVMFPQMRALLAKHPEYQKILFPESVFTEAESKAQHKAITKTRNAQPLLGFVDLAIAELLHRLGIVPDAVAGHSYGELPALAYAGAISPDDLPELSRQRAEAILANVGTDPGKMAAILMPAAEVGELLRDIGDVWAVNYNSPGQTVVGGTSVAIGRVLAICAQRGVDAKLVKVECAFHTPLLSGADEAFKAVLGEVEVASPQLPVWSNTTAQPYPSDPAQIRSRLGDHLVNPVLFSSELQAMYDDGFRVFIETGPSGVLTSLVDATLNDVLAIQTERKGGFGLRTLLRGLGGYLASGRDIKLEELFQGRGASLLDLRNPQQYAPSNTTWMVDGHAAVPIKKWREQGEKHLPALKLTQEELQEIATERKEMTSENAPGQVGSSVQAVPGQAVPSVQAIPGQAVPQQMGMPVQRQGEALLFAYLQNMRAMLDDQRDVMMGYLGYGQSVPTGAANQMSMVPQYPTLPPMAPMPPYEQYGVSSQWAAPGIPSGANWQMNPMPTQAQVTSPQVSYPSTPENVAGLDTVAALSANTDQVGPSPSEPAVAGYALPRVQDLSADQLRDVIVDVVAEKTGYPVEMLGMDMDLEADLSIDSIKRLEIISALSERVTMPEQAEEMDAAESASALEKMASIKTLRGMVDWLLEIAAAVTEAEHPDPGNPEAKNPTAVDSSPDTSKNLAAADNIPSDKDNSDKDNAEPPTEITRLVWEEDAAPFVVDGMLDLAGKRIAVTADQTEFAVALLAELERVGASGHLATSPADCAECDGLVFLNTAATGRKGVEDFFELAKGLDFSKLTWVQVYDDAPGILLASESLDLGRLTGFPGLIKSLQHEYQKVAFKVVTGLKPFEANSLASMVVQELSDPKRYPEIYYDGERRLRLLPKITEVDQLPDQISSGNAKSLTDCLDSDAVVLVLGGAQGISSELLSVVSASLPCRYVLVGRSTRDQALAAQFPMGLSQMQLQQYILDTESPSDPKALRSRVQQIVKLQSIETAISRLQAAGASASYHSVDLRDRSAFESLVAQVKADYGRIDAVLHAAGIVEDKLFRDKTWDSFCRVYDTKVSPLYVIGADLLDEIKLLVCCSSMVAAFGNRGQCDYAAANSVFDQAAFVLNAKDSPTKAVAIGWGPWKGAGMVSASLENQMRRNGASLIPLREGGRFFITELSQGHSPNVVVLAGKQLDIQRFITQTLSM
jgi:acyl transferase domain-containing protein/NAD(P)H-dependent flavin oxidoreductase YrpB (nitropropane dioxygenase family)/NAD(P)-dependent dehydrogenase (short-subunit alcohol dehydrogenase family)